MFTLMQLFRLKTCGPQTVVYDISDTSSVDSTGASATVCRKTVTTKELSHRGNREACCLQVQLEI